ncbi:MAG: HAMP domain-containing protein [Gammaproteobacteria bacterium]|nr:HAMP domain-containing protein [Gammaproteobacteria bacterium]NNC56176.1 HAMP domain-containing protein [Woeseiaceae bacterium]
MRSLLIRIFASFWSIILITIVVAVAIGYSYAERTRISMQNFEVGDAVLEASAALRENGREGLTGWLRSLPDATASLLYIVDEQGQDLLGRRLPTVIKMSVRRFGDRGPRPMRLRQDRPNLRPARPFTQLIGPDDRVYTIFVMPLRSVGKRWLDERGTAGLVMLALLVSAAVSYFLARTISRPIGRLRESANAIADGRLDTRVAEGVGKRRDEIGQLAMDFDRMADELQRAWLKQSELTRNVSHELRSPLARLRVALELVRRKTGDLPELDKIDAETMRLDELIGRILEFSRLDADPHEAKTPIDLDDLVRSVVDDVCYEYGDLGGNSSIEIHADAACSVNGYPNALRSCVENVLRNAMRHSRGDAKVQVHLGTEARQAVIAVEDQGGGVAEDELERIFEPFYRSKTTRADQSRRSGGLGLAIASRATALHGGSIRAVNKGNGLRVEIRLP